MQDTAHKKESGGKSLYLLSAVISAFGIVISVLLVQEHTFLTEGIKAGSSFCNISETINCHAVITSEFSKFLGISLASYGLFFYMLLFLFSLIVREGGVVSHETSRDVLFVISLAAFILSVVLFFVSKILIGALCPLCLGLYFVNTTLLVVTWFFGRSDSLIPRVQRGVSSVLNVPLVLVKSVRERNKAQLRFGGGMFSGAVIIVFITMMAPSIFIRLSGLRYDDEIYEDQPKLDVLFDISGGVYTDHYKGSSDAPVQIVEFADFECPSCRRAHFVIQDLLRENPGKILYVFKNYPLDHSCNPGIPDEFHLSACYAAEFARCAGEQGRYWEVADYLFTLDAIERHAPADEVREGIDKGVDDLGLDSIAMEECMNSDRHVKKIQLDIRHGDDLGLKATPFLLVNGKHAKKINPEILKKILEIELR